jgi:hypothetical protein
VRPKPRRPHHSSSRPSGPIRRTHPPRGVELPPEFEQLFAVLDDVYGDPRTAPTPLDAELWVSAFLGGLWKAAIQQDDEPEDSELGLVEVLETVGSPRTQAVLCALASVGSPLVASRAAAASERLVAKGVRRPRWYGPALQPVEFLEAWSVSDVFADGELLIAAFKRGKDEYAFTVTVANNAQGSVVEVLLIDPSDLPAILADIRAEFAEETEGVFSLDRLDAAELRRRLEPAVRETVVDDEDFDDFDGYEFVDDHDHEHDPEHHDHEHHGHGHEHHGHEVDRVDGAELVDADGQDDADADADLEYELDLLLEEGGDLYEDTDFDDDDDDGDDFASLRALILNRLGTLPEPTVLPGEAELGYDLDDLPDLIAEFTASEEARDLPHPAIVREWGEIFARLGIADFAGDPPLYGPEKFDMLINVLIPARVNADDVQLELLEPAAEAWARWSTRRVGLTEAVTEYLLDSVEESFEEFDDAYSDPAFAMDRQMFGFTMLSKPGE